MSIGADALDHNDLAAEGMHIDDPTGPKQASANMKRQAHQAKGSGQQPQPHEDSRPSKQAGAQSQRNPSQDAPPPEPGNMEDPLATSGPHPLDLSHAHVNPALPIDWAAMAKTNPGHVADYAHAAGALMHGLFDNDVSRFAGHALSGDWMAPTLGKGIEGFASGDKKAEDWIGANVVPKAGDAIGAAAKKTGFDKTFGSGYDWSRGTGTILNEIFNADVATSSLDDFRERVHTWWQHEDSRNALIHYLDNVNPAAADPHQWDRAHLHEEDKGVGQGLSMVASFNPLWPLMMMGNAPRDPRKAAQWLQEMDPFENVAKDVQGVKENPELLLKGDTYARVVSHSFMAAIMLGAAKTHTRGAISSLRSVPGLQKVLGKAIEDTGAYRLDKPPPVVADESVADRVAALHTPADARVKAAHQKIDEFTQKAEDRVMAAAEKSAKPKPGDDPDLATHEAATEKAQQQIDEGLVHKPEDLAKLRERLKLRASETPEHDSIDQIRADTEKLREEQVLVPKGVADPKATDVEKKAAKKALQKLGLTDTHMSLLDKLHADDGEGFTPKQTEQLLQNADLFRRVYGMPNDIVRVFNKERAFEDPMVHVQHMTGPAQEAFRGFIQGNLQRYLHELYSGIHVNEDSMAHSLRESLFGNHNSLGFTHADFIAGLHGLRQHLPEGIDGNVLRRAAENPEAYHALESPEAKAIVDIYRAWKGAYAEQAHPLGILKGQRDSFVDRIRESLPMPKGEKPAQTGAHPGGEFKRHRTETLQPDRRGGDDPAVMQQHENIDDLNAAQKQKREDMVRGLMGEEEEFVNAQGEPDVKAAGPGRLDRAKYTEVKKEIQQLLKTDPRAATAKAKEVAAAEYETYHGDLFDIMGKSMEKQARELKTQQALHFLSEQHWRAPDGQLVGAAHRSLSNVRDADLRGVNQHFRTVNAPGFNDWLVPKDMAKLIEDGAKGVSDPSKYDKIAGQMVRNVVFFPPVHLMNIARRNNTFILANQHALLDEVLGIKNWLTEDRATRALRIAKREQEAYQAGVVGYTKNRRVVSDINNVAGHALGDERATVSGSWDASDLGPAAAKGPHKYDSLTKVGKSLPGRGYQAMQDFLWNKVKDFGVFAYHVEKRNALAGGMSETDARIYAAKKANAWAGHVQSWDRDATTGRMARRMFLAPTWQRSFVDSFAHTYRKEALSHSPEMQKYVLTHDLRATGAYLVANHVIGNLINMVLAGHPQTAMFGMKGNDPDNVNKIQLDRFAGKRGKDGASLTIPNYAGSNQLDDWEKVFAPSWLGGVDSHVAGRAGVAATELVGKMNPALNMFIAAWNVDAYRSVRDGTIRQIDRKQGPFNPHALLQAAANGTPLGQMLSVLLREQHAQAGDPWAGTPLGKDFGPFSGITLPKVIKDQVLASPADAASGALAFFLGAQKPFWHAPKSTPKLGQQADDNELNQKDEKLTTIRTQQASSDAELFGGSQPAWEWWKATQDRLKDERNTLNMIYKGAPHFTQGIMGHYFDYMDLYSKATKPDGSLDYGKLHDSQAEFLGKLSPKERDDMLNYQQQRQVQSPGLRLYHSVIAHYAHQRLAAAGSPAQATQMEKLYDQYTSFTDPNQAEAFKRQHPEMGRFTKAMSAWETSDYAGMLWALFHHHTSMIKKFEKQHPQAQVMDRMKGASEQEYADAQAQVAPG